MKLLEKYTSKLDINNLEKKGGFNWLRPEITDQTLKDVKKLQFCNLYAHLISGIVDSNLHLNSRDSIKHSLEKFRNKFDYYQNNKLTIKQSAEKSVWKFTINSFYGQLGFLSETGQSEDFQSYVCNYLHLYYFDLIQKNEDKILYIDSDQVFYKGEIDLLNIDVSFDLENIDYIQFKQLKRYIYKKDKILTHGYGKNDKMPNLESFKSYIRQDRLDSIGINCN